MPTSADVRTSSACLRNASATRRVSKTSGSVPKARLPNTISIATSPKPKGSQPMNSATEKFLVGLTSNELLLRLTWDEWLGIEAPYDATKVTTADAWTRYHRNGYDWDMH